MNNPQPQQPQGRKAIGSSIAVTVLTVIAALFFFFTVPMILSVKYEIAKNVAEASQNAGAGATIGAAFAVGIATALLVVFTIILQIAGFILSLIASLLGLGKVKKANKAGHAYLLVWTILAFLVLAGHIGTFIWLIV